ncbi:hypothetical protein [Streptomyces sp. NBC_01750]|nr:hypothetical protein [Streptomyces sp. NBC_01750]WSD38168.1 hypothetical protein OG966_40460 [Streptomyces sp. NBC_01750]
MYTRTRVGLLVAVVVVVLVLLVLDGGERPRARRDGLGRWLPTRDAAG